MGGPDPAHHPAHTQGEYAVRCEWGPVGATAIVADLGPRDLAVVVDVLSFSTTVTVAVAAGATVWPYRWKDDRAAAFAAEQDAVLAVGRLEARTPGSPPQARVSLSPAEIGAAAAPGARFVLPSPNGATISAAIGEVGVPVVAGCLRNATAVARRADAVLAAGGRVAVVPCGERWPDGSLRPAQEDWWGAGAILAALTAPVALSAEALAAADAHRAAGPGALAGSASGRELVAKGYADDVEVAGQLDADVVVPILRDGAFVST